MNRDSKPESTLAVSVSIRRTVGRATVTSRLSSLSLDPPFSHGSDHDTPH